MGSLYASFNNFLTTINDVLWHDSVLYIILAVGFLFMVWSKFSPWLALTHGVQVIRGKYDHKGDPGAISHFQALSAALSATVGLGNIGGVSVAIALGGPGAVFWMWVVGFVGMALKMTEVTQAMMYRNTDDPENPHGGAMWVVHRGLAEMNPKWAGIGKVIAYIFCVTLLISTVTGGNMFQAWSVGDVTEANFGVPAIVSGIIMTVLCGLVIIGGIKRIGAVAGMLVPFMCGIYMIAAIAVLIAKADVIPSVILLIFQSAFSSATAEGAFIGGTVGYAFLWGMKRALFSNEAGQGSAPIAHAAARTDEPVREGIVAGLEPFIDTLIVCSLTALVILASGAWNRPAATTYPADVHLVSVGDHEWTLPSAALPAISGNEVWSEGQSIFVVVDGDAEKNTGNNYKRLFGTVVQSPDGFTATWQTLKSEVTPSLRNGDLYIEYASASLTSFAFDMVFNGLGKWMVTFAAWLFAVSTMISWSYYGEQGMVYMFGARSVLPYKIVYCLLILVSTSGLITTTDELDNLSGVGTGVMLFANIPIMLFFGAKTMRAYHDYVRRLKAGQFKTVF